jgi:hypothetical protein
MSDETITISLTLDEFADMVASGFDEADGRDYGDDGDYHDYYWCAAYHTFQRMKEKAT